MTETNQSANVFARIVLEQTQPEALKQAMSNAHLSLYTGTMQSVKHESKAVDQNSDL
jgi:hypothetical protein